MLCRQASKLAPRHLSWLSALSSLGETNRCALLLFCSELITGFQAGEISKASLASAFSSRGVTCRQDPQPWLSNVIWSQIPVSLLPRLSPPLPLMLALAGPPGCAYLFSHMRNELAVLQEGSAFVVLFQRIFHCFR